MHNLRLLGLIMAVCACLFRAGVFAEVTGDTLPHLTGNLHLEDDVRSFIDDSVLGTTVSDGHHRLASGFGMRKQVLAAFGPPPRISVESGREIWCYRLPPNCRGESLHLTVSFDGWLGLDQLTHFTLGKKKWVIFDEPNHNLSPALAVWDI